MLREKQRELMRRQTARVIETERSRRIEAVRQLEVCNEGPLLEIAFLLRRSPHRSLWMGGLCLSVPDMKRCVRASLGLSTPDFLS